MNTAGLVGQAFSFDGVDDYVEIAPSLFWGLLRVPNASGGDLAVPSAARDMKNPVALTDDVLPEAMAHFADHCAICHGNDGKGQTQIGRNLYPKAPDMASSRTQSLSDGELFYIIKNGVRLTGMPAWGEDTSEHDRESWKLVHFIRHLPEIGLEEIQEMEEMNPKSRAEFEEEEEIRRFLAGEDPPPTHLKHDH